MLSRHGLMRLREITNRHGGHGRPQRVIRCNQPVIPMPMLSSRWNNRCQPIQNLKWAQLHHPAGPGRCRLPCASRPHPVASLVPGQGIANPLRLVARAWHHRQPLQRQRRPGAVSQQMLQTPEVLRLIVGQTLSKIHRTHLQTESRSVLREANDARSGLWGNTSLCLSQRFIAHMTSPSQVAVKGELIDEVRQALDGMSEMDQEVLALRHFEELTNQEVAIELGINPKASSIPYMLALERLRGVLEMID